MGYIAAFLYAILTALSALFIENKISTAGSTNTILFLSFVIAALFFHINGYKNITKAYKNIIRDKKNYILMCIYVGMVWVLSVYGVSYSNALMFNIFMFMSSALIAHLASYVKNHKNKLSLWLSIVIICILSATLLQNSKLIYGILMGVVAGAGAHLYRQASAKFSMNNSATVAEVLMVRFIPASILLLPFLNFNLLPATIHQHLPIILIFAFLSLIIPIFFMQYAVNHIGAIHVSIISATVFPFIWFGDFILHYSVYKHGINWYNLFVATISFVVIMIPYVHKPKRKVI